MQKNTSFGTSCHYLSSNVVWRTKWKMAKRYKSNIYFNWFIKHQTTTFVWTYWEIVLISFIHYNIMLSHITKCAWSQKAGVLFKASIGNLFRAAGYKVSCASWTTAAISSRSAQLNSDAPIQFEDGWPFGNRSNYN